MLQRKLTSRYGERTGNVASYLPKRSDKPLRDAPGIREISTEARRLPEEPLELRRTEKYGGKVNGVQALRTTSGPDKNEHFSSEPLRAQLPRQSKLPLVEVNRILCNLARDLSKPEKAAQRGWSLSTEKGRIVKRQPVTHLLDVNRAVPAFPE